MLKCLICHGRCLFIRFQHCAGNRINSIRQIIYVKTGVTVTILIVIFIITVSVIAIVIIAIAAIVVIITAVIVITAIVVITTIVVIIIAVGTATAEVTDFRITAEKICFFLTLFYLLNHVIRNIFFHTGICTDADSLSHDQYC